MTTPDNSITHLLNELAPLAKALNMKSDGLNTIITGVEAQLAKLGVGLEVWLTTDEHALRSRRLPPRPRTDREVDPAGSDSIEQVELGYARVGSGGWVLAIRTVVWREEWEVLSETAPLALVHAPREIRIAALKRFPALVVALKEAATRAIAEINEAAGTVTKQNMTPCPTCGTETQPGRLLQKIGGPDDLAIWHYDCSHGHKFHVALRKDGALASEDYDLLSPCNCTAPDPTRTRLFQPQN